MIENGESLYLVDFRLKNKINRQLWLNLCNIFLRNIFLAFTVIFSQKHLITLFTAAPRDWEPANLRPWSKAELDHQQMALMAILVKYGGKVSREQSVAAHHGGCASLFLHVIAFLSSS